MSGLSEYPVAGVLRAERFDRAKRFYTEVLGLPITKELGTDSAMFGAGGGSMFMVYERPGMPAPENTALGFALSVDGFDAAVTELRANGVVFVDYDMPEMGLTTVDGVATDGDAKMAWFKDSEGNIINIATM